MGKSKTNQDPDEFNINNFPDPAEHGKKAQCDVCHKWDYFINLSSEDGISFYHPKCETDDSYNRRMK